MKVCSVCRQCYDDSVTNCSADDNGILNRTRAGNPFSVEGCELDFRVESDSPFEIYKATHLDSEKSILIRFIKTDESGDELLKEIETVAAINHPNLARVYEFGKVSDNEIFVVLENIPGQNLRSFLEKNSPLKERHAIKIARQIAEALEELHTKNIIHRAVSPANIYFTNFENSDFGVKLQNYDFGGIIQKSVAKGANGIDPKTEVFRYYSPEQFSGEEIDFKSDIYSLAVVFYEMLLASSPYSALNPQTISNYAFNESDTEKLHFDLRALLAYTLHESLQHKPHLRPPTTNNLARQYRHLELVATPPEIGLLKKTKKNQPKPIKKISGYQASNSETAEKHLIEEVKISEPEMVETKVEELEKHISPTGQIEFEVLPVESISEISPDANEFESVETFEEPIQTEIREINVENFSDEEIKDEIAEFSETADEEIEPNEIKLIEETGFAEAEYFSEDIHITNKDLPVETEDFAPEIVEIPEPEFIVTSNEKKTPERIYEMNSFDAYSQPRSFGVNKIYIYTAGILALIFAGIVSAVIISNRNNDSTVIKNPSSIPANANAVEKRNPNFEKINQITQENKSEIPDTSEAVIKTDSEQDVQSDAPTETEKKSIATPPIVEKTVEKSAEKKPAKEIKKQPVKNQPGKRDETVATKKINAGKSKPNTNAAAGMTRPRIVSDVKPKD